MHEAIFFDPENFHSVIGKDGGKAVFILNPMGEVVSWNSGGLRILGYEADSIIHRHVQGLFPVNASGECLAEALLTMASTKGRYACDGVMVKAGGRQFEASIESIALRDTHDSIAGFLWLVTEKGHNGSPEKENRQVTRRLEEQLHKSQLEMLAYRHALDESSIVAITDHKGVIRYVNDNFCAISKYPRKELIGQDHRLINSGYHPKEFFKTLWDTITSGRIWRGEIRNRARDGGLYWVDTTIVPFLNEDGRPYQYLAIRADITRKKEAEEELMRINENLEKTVRERTLELTRALEREKELGEMKSRFVSVASHEFRTPLSAVLSGIALVEHYIAAGQEEKRKKYIDRIRSSVRNLTDILDDFLSMDKLEHGRVEAHNASFFLRDLVEEVIGEMDVLLRKKEQWIVYVQPDTIEVFQDRHILHNILLNLLSNASKYSAERLPIRIDVAASGDDVLISVTDRGIGIPKSAQKNLFTRFYRADNAANIQGTGLGLNIVARYLDLLGGDIRFVSAVRKGSTFTVRFPRQALARQ
jgi:PAS domain S-box-containing protein